MERINNNLSIEIQRHNVDPSPKGYQLVTDEVIGLSSDTGYNVSVVAAGPWGIGRMSEELYFKTRGSVVLFYKYYPCCVI